MSTKIFDAAAMFFDAQDVSSWGTGAHNSSSVDLHGTDGWEVDQYRPPEVVIKCDSLGSAGSATLTITLQDSADDATFAAVTPMGIASAAIDYDDAQLSEALRFQIPKGTRRYVRLSITVGTAALNAGTINAGLVK